MYDYRVRNVVITGQLNVLNTAILFIFRSGEHKPFTLLLQIHNDYPLNIRITIIPTSQHPIQLLPVSRLY